MKRKHCKKLEHKRSFRAFCIDLVLCSALDLPLLVKSTLTILLISNDRYSGDRQGHCSLCVWWHAVGSVMAVKWTLFLSCYGVHSDESVADKSLSYNLFMDLFMSGLKGVDIVKDVNLIKRNFQNAVILCAIHIIIAAQDEHKSVWISTKEKPKTTGMITSIFLKKRPKVLFWRFSVTLMKITRIKEMLRNCPFSPRSTACGVGTRQKSGTWFGRACRWMTWWTSGRLSCGPRWTINWPWCTPCWTRELLSTSRTKTVSSKQWLSSSAQRSYSLTFLRLTWTSFKRV